MNIIKLAPMVQELLKTEAGILDRFLLDVMRNIPQATIKKDIGTMVAMGRTDPYATAASTLEWILQHYPKNAQVERLVMRYLKPVGK